MKLTSMAPMLWTEDIPASVAFYCKTLAFVCQAQMEGWACVERDGIELMLARHPINMSTTMALVSRAHSIFAATTWMPGGNT